MRDRKKRNIIIGALCCLLVFMGIGYAILSQTLNISGIANMKGDWNLKITNVELVGTNGMAEDVSHTFTDTTATIKGKMYMPGDSTEYKVTVTNAGNIDAKLSSIAYSSSTGDELSDIKFTSNAVEGRILKAGDTYVFNVKTVFSEEATSLPEKGKTPSYTLTLQYTQYDREKTYSIARSETKDDCFTIDTTGTITSYDFTCGTSVIVPDNVNGTAVKGIGENAFKYLDYSKFNIYVYNENDKAYYVFDDQEVYDLFIQFSALDGYTKMGFKKYVESEAAKEGKTISEFLASFDTDTTETFTTVDDYINYKIPLAENEIKAYVEVAFKDKFNYDGKTLAYAIIVRKVNDETIEEGGSGDGNVEEALTTYPLTELDLSRTTHLEKLNCLSYIPNLKKLNLSGNLKFTYENAFNETYIDEVETKNKVYDYMYTLDELIVDTDTISNFEINDSETLVTCSSIAYKFFRNTKISKMVILSGKSIQRASRNTLLDSSIICLDGNDKITSNSKTSISELAIEDGVREIGKEMFSGVNLTKVSFPNSIVKIDSRAFAYNETLTNDGLGKLSKELTQLSLDTFEKDVLLTQITLTSTNDIDGWSNGSRIILDSYDNKYAKVVYER